MPKGHATPVRRRRAGLAEVLNGKAHALRHQHPDTGVRGAEASDTLFLPIPEPFVQGAEGFDAAQRRSRRPELLQ